MALIIEDAINVTSPSEFDSSEDEKAEQLADCTFSLSSHNTNCADLTPILGAPVKPSESRRLDYKTLKSASSVRNVLLQYGNKNSMASKNRQSTSSYNSYSSYSACSSGRYAEKKTQFPVKSAYDAATAIQKNVRRFLVLRQYELKDNERVNTRQVVVRDAIARSGGNPNSFDPNSPHFKSQYESMNKEISMLVEKLKYFETPPVIVQQILLILFTCSSDHSDFITASECAFLLVDVIHLPFTKSQITDQDGILSTFKCGGSTVDFTDLYIWFKRYKDDNPYSKPSSFTTFVNNLLSDYLPTNFLLRYMDYKAKSFDIILSLYQYDKINPPRFQCKYCSKIYKLPMDLAKHQIHCEKGPTKGLKNKSDNVNKNHHHHHHHHHHHSHSRNRNNNNNNNENSLNENKNHQNHQNHRERKTTNRNDSHSNYNMQSRSRHDKVRVYPSNLESIKSNSEV